MTDKVFVDSNIWLYAFIQSKGDQEKRVKAKACIVDADEIVISTQVVNEVCINLMRKGNKDDAFIDQFIHDFILNPKLQKPLLYRNILKHNDKIDPAYGKISSLKW